MPSYIPAYRYGGPVKAVHELCRALVKEGHDISVFTTNADQEKRLNTPLNRQQMIEGVKVTYYPVGLLSAYYYSRDMNNALKSRIGEFDLVHIHSVFLYPTLAAAYWCRKKKIPYIINPFGALDPDMIRLGNTIIKNIYIKLVEQNNIKRAAAVHVASEYEKKQFLSLGLGAPTAVVPRGLDLGDYESSIGPDDFRQRYPQLKGRDIILFLGRIHFKKGLDILAPALKEVVRERKNVCLVVAGPSEKGYADKIKALFKGLGLEGHVLFTGMLLGDDKLAALYAGDIFVLPSYGENFGIAVLEAMACKMPVVITNKVGLYPDVERYKAGLVVDCKDTQIAGAIITLLKEQDLRRSMGENGRRLTEDRFTWDKVAGNMVRVYSSIIKHK